VAIQASVQPRQIGWNILYTVICGGLALWGAWDYWVTIPRAEANFERYTEAVAIYQTLSEKSQQDSLGLSAEETASFLLAEAELAEFAAPPVKPAAYDRPVQLWLYMVGCGLLGTPFFVWNLISLPRQARRWRLEDDGSLATPEGLVPADEIVDIDMTRWMAKSIGTVLLRDGRKVPLDDYKFRDMHLIVGALATRFHPEEWTSEARMKTAAVVEDATEATPEPAEATEPPRVRTTEGG